MTELAAQWAALVGFSAIVSVIVNLLKTVGVIKDGQSQNWVAGFDLLGMAMLLGLKVFNPDYDISGLDDQLAQIAETATIFIGFIVQLLSSKITHLALKGIPWIGTSLTKLGLLESSVEYDKAEEFENELIQ